MATPHLVRNVEVVLEIRKKREMKLVLMPLLHEDDPNWPRERIAAALRIADATIANTAWEKDRIIDSYGIPRDRVFVGGVGTDVCEGPPVVHDHPFSITYLGRLTLKKGIRLLIEAMLIVWERAGSVPLNLIGASTNDRQEIQSLVDCLPPDKRSNVKIASDVTDGYKDEVLRNASSLLVLPSTNESFGIVILEAWAHRVPIVVPKTPLFESIVDDGRDGFLVVPRPEDLAECILSARANPARLQKMGDLGQLKVRTLYNWKPVGRRFLEAYCFAANCR